MRGQQVVLVGGDFHLGLADIERGHEAHLDAALVGSGQRLVGVHGFPPQFHDLLGESHIKVSGHDEADRIDDALAPVIVADRAVAPANANRGEIGVVTEALEERLVDRDAREENVAGQERLIEVEHDIAKVIDFHADLVSGAEGQLAFDVELVADVLVLEDKRLVVDGAGVAVAAGCVPGSGTGVGATAASISASASCWRRICCAVSALVMVVGFCGMRENS